MHSHETVDAVFQALLDPETDLAHSARALGLPLSEFLVVTESPAIRAELDALEKLAAIQAQTVIARALHTAALALERIAAGDDRPPAVVETCRKAASQILRLAGKSVTPPRDDPESPPDTPPEPTPSPPDDHATEPAARDRPTNPALHQADDRNSPAAQDARGESNAASHNSDVTTSEIPNPAPTPDHTAASVISRLQSAKPATLREAFNSIADLVGGQAMETHTGRLAFKAGLERLLDTLPDAHIESEPAAPEPDGVHALQHFTLLRPNEPPARFALRLVADSTTWRLENIIPDAQPRRDSS